jgi:hypothetical protein
VRHGGVVGPEVRGVRYVARPGGHACDVCAEGDEECVGGAQSAAEGLDRLVVGGGHYGEAGRDAGVPGRGLGDLAQDVAGQHEIAEHLAGDTALGDLRVVVAPLPGARVERPCAGVVGRRIPEGACHAVADVAGAGRDAGGVRIGVRVRLGDPLVQLLTGWASVPSALRTARQNRMVHRPTPLMSAGSPSNAASAARIAAPIDVHRSSSGCSSTPGRGCRRGAARRGPR